MGHKRRDAPVGFPEVAQNMLDGIANGVEGNWGQGEYGCDRCPGGLHAQARPRSATSNQKRADYRLRLAVLRRLQSNSLAACRAHLHPPPPLRPPPPPPPPPNTHLARRAQECVVGGVEPRDGVRAVGGHETLRAALVPPEHVWRDSSGRASRDRREGPSRARAHQDMLTCGRVCCAMKVRCGRTL